MCFLESRSRKQLDSFTRSPGMNQSRCSLLTQRRFIMGCGCRGKMWPIVTKIIGRTHSKVEETDWLGSATLKQALTLGNLIPIDYRQKVGGEIDNNNCQQEKGYFNILQWAACFVWIRTLIMMPFSSKIKHFIALVGPAPMS